jgi:hypothetical protein
VGRGGWKIAFSVMRLATDEMEFWIRHSGIWYSSHLFDTTFIYSRIVCLNYRRFFARIAKVRISCPSIVEVF